MTVEHVDIDAAYNDLLEDYHKLQRKEENMNIYIRRLVDENEFLRECVLKAVGGNKNDV